MVLLSSMHARWHGHTPLVHLFWRDLLAWGSLFNGLMVFVGLMLYAKRVDPVVAWGVHLLALPVNLFLVACVWRHPAARAWIKGVAAAWLALTLVV